MSEALSHIEQAQSLVDNLAVTLSNAESALENDDGLDKSTLADALEDIASDLSSVRYELPGEGTEVGSVQQESDDVAYTIEKLADRLESLVSDLRSY